MDEPGLRATKKPAHRRLFCLEQLLTSLLLRLLRQRCWLCGESWTYGVSSCEPPSCAWSSYARTTYGRSSSEPRSCGRTFYAWSSSALRPCGLPYARRPYERFSCEHPLSYDHPS